MLLSSVNCVGSEGRLLECGPPSFIDSRCTTHDRDVGVKCQGQFIGGEVHETQVACATHKAYVAVTGRNGTLF